MSQAARPPIRLVIVDDHPIVRKGLVEIINAEPDMTVCGEADSAASGLDAIRAERPDVAIVDLSLGMDSGLQLVKTIEASQLSVRVLVLSMHDETLHAERALAAGAGGYIMKDEAPQSLIGAIRSVAAGKTWVSARISERIVSRMTGRRSRQEGEDHAAFERLTDREREVFALVGRGMTTREIAQKLGRSVKTIETYQSRIKEKLGLANAHEMIRAAVSWSQT